MDFNSFEEELEFEIALLRGNYFLKLSKKLQGKYDAYKFCLNILDDFGNKPDLFKTAIVNEIEKADRILQYAPLAASDDICLISAIYLKSKIQTFTKLLTKYSCVLI